ncbi:MAG: saccharopine dehydrogenase NADP-binding domain-containing protein, partial [Nocardioides sp.]
MTDSKTYDVVVLGATGFTARLATAHLAANLPADGVRWALAGRSQERLEGVRADLVAINPSLVDLPILIVDITSASELTELARSTKVLVNATGPYLMHGEPVVRACATEGTDYVDLCGEPEFVDLMYLAHHETAARTGARLVHAAGFDSVPHDLGALHAVSQIDASGPVTLRGIVRATGGVSGGTAASLLNAFSRLRQMRDAATRRAAAEDAITTRTSRQSTGRPHRDPVTGLWLLPMPAIDQAIVARSGASLAQFGSNFTYSHFAGLRHLPVLIGGLAGVGVGLGLAQIGPVRRLVSARLPQGAGPDDATGAAASFTVDFIAEHAGGRTHTQVAGPDPYDLSGIALIETALSLAFDDNPDVAGQVTTAQACGAALTRRLANHGMTMSVVSTSS